MPVIDAKRRSDQWHKLLVRRKKRALLASLKGAPIVDVADFLCSQPLNLFVSLFLLFDTKRQAELFGHLHEGKQLELYYDLPRREMVKIFIQMPSDLRADFYQRLNDKQQIKLLPYLPKDVRKDVIVLSTYLPEQAGSIMSTDFVTVSSDITTEDALAQLRNEAPPGKVLLNLYAVDEEMKMLGLVSLKNLVLAKPATKIVDILEETFVFAKVTDDKELVARKIEKYDLVAVPILNDEQQIVGIVSCDDAMEVIREEETEDMEKFMGIVPDEHGEDYLHASSTQHFRKRIGWLVSLFGVSIFSGLVIHYHESLISKWAILALYITTINDAGGNAGSQAATVIIRAIALGQISFKNWVIVLLKELKIAFMSVMCLFLLAFAKVVFLSGIISKNTPNGLPLPNEGVYVLGLVIAISLSIQVLTATLIGASLPLFIHWLGKDPALVASPAITTIVDITGLLIYFSVALLLLS